MGIELLGRKLNVPNISSFHPRFKIYRKLLHSGLSSRATQTYLPLITEETHVFLSNLASSPEKFVSHIRRCNYFNYSVALLTLHSRNTGAVTLKIAYGWSVKENDDHFVKLVEEIFRIMSEMFRPGQWLVDDFPWLRFVPAWAPGAEFQRKAANAREHFNRIGSIPFNWAKEQIVSDLFSAELFAFLAYFVDQRSGDYIESFTSKGLLSKDAKPLSQEEDDILNRCSQSLYAGGVDTVSPDTT